MCHGYLQMVQFFVYLTVDNWVQYLSRNYHFLEQFQLRHFLKKNQPKQLGKISYSNNLQKDALKVHVVLNAYEKLLMQPQPRRGAAALD